MPDKSIVIVFKSDGMGVAANQELREVLTRSAARRPSTAESKQLGEPGLRDDLRRRITRL